MESNAEHEDGGGLCRETAQTLLLRRIKTLEQDLDGLKGLLKIANHLEPGSSVEASLWQLLIGQKHYL